MRILLALIMAVTLASQSAEASDQPKTSLVIIDTGFDTSIPVIGDATIFEACILDWSMCPNGTSMQEGAGAATIRSTSTISSGIAHGTQMASIAVDINPQQKLILIRLIAYNARGQRMTVFDSSVGQVFRWIVKRREELHIGAVAMAQGHHGLLAGKSYCPRSADLEKSITELKLMGVPVFFPAGNASDKARIDWPACIPAAVAIGAADTEGMIAKYSNYDRNLVDFYAPGNAQVLMPGGARSSTSGTSVSTIVAASQWLLVATENPSLSYSQIAQVLRDSGPIIFDDKYRYGRMIDLQSALARLKS
ncbi:T7SS_mycosin, type VII secretion-associated serine protease mycosin [Candidatus Nanopelagicaceae bacterium]